VDGRVRVVTVVAAHGRRGVSVVVQVRQRAVIEQGGGCVVASGLVGRGARAGGEEEEGHHVMASGRSTSG
jgi:hypothetical protein